MPDNVTLNVGSGGDLIGADDIGGIKYQRMKLIFGPDSISKGDVDTANPLPVFIAAQPSILSGGVHYTGAVTDAAILTPTAGKQLNITRLTITTANGNTADLVFRIGCGTSTTPAYGTPGLILSHAGMANAEDFSVGNGRDPIGNGAANQPLRITATDPAGSFDCNYEYYES